MNNNTGESITTTKTFRFDSGQLLTLDQDQIEKIPYLAALVSSADNFELVCDENGHYKLDPRIRFKQFSFAIESLSFHSVRQLFTHLPKQNDIIPIIALLDFLGIAPQPDPTLKEVDSTFFSNLVYSPLLEKYIQTIRPSDIQDMAVRFAITMAKEEYNFTSRKVIDQLHWFIMFILSAYELFGPRLRHHIHKIAEHCFSLFKPSLLKSLKKLIWRTEKDTSKLILITGDEDVGSDAENKRALEQVMDIGYPDHFYFFGSPSLERRQELLLRRRYSDYSTIWFWRPLNEEKLLEPIHKRVLEIMYMRLQSQICQHVVTEMRRRPRSYKVEQKLSDEGISHDIFEHPFTLMGMWSYKLNRERARRITITNKTDKRILRDIFECELVQEEIRERILEEIRELTPKLKKKHGELVKEIQVYYQHQGTFHGDIFSPVYISLFDSLDFEHIQETALAHELVLEKFHQCSNIVEQIRENVLTSLYEVAQEQMINWNITEQKIVELRLNLAYKCPLDKLLDFTSKTRRQHYQIPANKPLPKIQSKYSAR